MIVKRSDIIIRRAAQFLVTGILAAVAFLCVFPLIYVTANTFMPASEINRYYSALGGSEGVSFHLIPDQLSMEGYLDVFFRQPEYMVKFWNSMFITVSILLGQITVSTLAGYAFAKLRFPFRDGLFFIYIVFMMLPYLVTLVPNELVIRNLGLLDTHAAIILPAIFSPFGVFIMRQVIAAIPNELLEASHLDGAGYVRTFFHIILPQSKAGIAALVVLSFIDSWNIMEQALIFLNDAGKYPLSVFLTFVNTQKIDVLFVCSVLAIVPVMLLFFFFEEEFTAGIEYMGFQ